MPPKAPSDLPPNMPTNTLSKAESNPYSTNPKGRASIPSRLVLRLSGQMVSILSPCTRDDSEVRDGWESEIDEDDGETGARTGSSRTARPNQRILTTPFVQPLIMPTSFNSLPATSASIRSFRPAEERPAPLPRFASPPWRKCICTSQWSLWSRSTSKYVSRILCTARPSTKPSTLSPRKQFPHIWHARSYSRIRTG